jgi:hypothetical protein
MCAALTLRRVRVIVGGAPALFAFAGSSVQ